MAILRKEYYTQLNGAEIIKGILKPTKNFPEGGYFYAPREAESLVDSYTWCLSKSGKRVQVVAVIHKYSVQNTLLFHKELFKFYRGYDWNADIDHISLCEIDNIDQNLNAITHQQNKFNILSRGYRFDKDWCHFQVKYRVNSKNYFPFSVTHKEDEVCIQANYIDQVILRERLGDDYYMFDFLKYRRGSEDILDLERRGIISEEEATYRHILKYSDNAWYYLRFGLEQYFKANNIPVPQYSLDEQGFMVHPETGKKLCPFYSGKQVEKVIKGGYENV